MKKRIYTGILTLALLSTSFSSKAQLPNELLRFSEYDWSFGTARSAAMGGAFSSLGADLSSMMLNPAGLGMYRRSEVGFTTSFTTMKVKSKYSDQMNGNQWDSFRANDNRNRFAFNNIGGAFNVYNGSGSLTSVTLGFAYNKIADFNTKSEITGLSNTSMSEYFAGRMNQSGILPGDIDKNLSQGRNFLYYADMLAYKANIIRHDEDGYYADLTNEAYGNFSQLIRTKGSIGQYDFAIGMNFTNKFYLGLGFGVQDIYYKEYNSYYEKAEDNNQPGNEWALDDFQYDRFLKQTGTAWNFKIGAIFRPIEELRIAAAFHTPTYISMDEDYGQQAFSLTGTESDGNDTETDRFYIYGPYNIKTPMRLMLGSSYVLYNTAILSFDYERVWYNKMKLYDDDWDFSDKEMTAQVKSIYRPVNNFRVGLETQLDQNWFGRVGFAYYQGMYKNQNLRGNQNMLDGYKGERVNYSGGFGYRTALWGIDFAYVYMDSKGPATYIYDYADNEGRSSKAYRTRGERHNVTMTCSFRF